MNLKRASLILALAGVLSLSALAPTLAQTNPAPLPAAPPYTLAPAEQ